jgi:thioredoxin reductase (NADPH)
MERWRDISSNASPCSRLFLFVGADPNADWLEHRVQVDNGSFVLTGGDFVNGAGSRRRRALPLETS